MPTLVTEFNPTSTRNDHIEVDDDLIFPNIQSCVGVFADLGTELVGVHLTVGDKNKKDGYDAVVQKFLAKCKGQRPTAIYAIGAVTNEWHQLLRKFGVSVKYFSTQPGKKLDPHNPDKSFYIDLRVRKQSGNLKFAMQPASPDPHHPNDAFQPVDAAMLHLL